MNKYAGPLTLRRNRLRGRPTKRIRRRDAAASVDLPRDPSRSSDARELIGEEAKAKAARRSEARDEKKSRNQTWPGIENSRG